MKKTLLILTALYSTSALTNNTDLIGNNLNESPENVAPAFHNPPKEVDVPALNYVNQPPMIPHSVKGYQVTKNNNQCLNCHSPENSRVTGATRISPTHFMDRNGNINGDASPRRYFCLQCHVTQSDVEPIIPNQFKPMKGYGK
ncbi:nitrate reductase cytochrome c-type subunit [Bisgaardia hudsonensis]|nr:nitrate reductase cytochrome c-type subunit [Bisgaardia hudsonensis]